MIDWNPDKEGNGTGAGGRAADRITLILIAEIRGELGHNARMRVRNLSQTGFGGVVDVHHPFQVGDPVKVGFGSYSKIDATVMRVNGVEVGLRFDETVDLDRIRTARANPPQAFEPLGMHKVKTPQWMIERAKRGF